MIEADIEQDFRADKVRRIVRRECLQRDGVGSKQDGSGGKIATLLGQLEQNRLETCY